jgi:predicted ATPase
MARKLDKLSISGFKSIRELVDFKLGDLNVLIGGNGAGKSNFIDVFRLLSALVGKRLQGHVLESGGIDGFLHNGPKVTEAIHAEFSFGENDYGFTLVPASDGRVIIGSEKGRYTGRRTMSAGNISWKNFGGNMLESKLDEVKEWSGIKTPKGIGYYINESVTNWVVYHFHDTSKNAPMRRSEIIQDYERLRPDASNVAPYILRLREKNATVYNEIVNAVRLVTPFFDDFLLRPQEKGDGSIKVSLEWTQKGSDYPMQPHHFSDGTLRFICLATALLQPNSPSTILIDEPELGLHPYAIEVLGDLIKDTAKRTQVIISTQSAALVDCFDAKDIVTVNRAGGASTFGRLDEAMLAAWLEEYSLGELWRKNVLTGGPSYE